MARLVFTSFCHVTLRGSLLGRIGGSRAQRDLVDLTLIAACIKADRPEAASALIERRAHLPRLLDVPEGRSRHLCNGAADLGAEQDARR